MQINQETTYTYRICRRPLDSSDCPVCCDEFDEASVDGIVFCIVCGNNIHKVGATPLVVSGDTNPHLSRCRSALKRGKGQEGRM
jgi:hypothetical protein